MVLKPKSAWLICIIFVLSVGAWLAKRLLPHHAAYTERSTRVIVIHKLLFHLRQECVQGNIDHALNTMEDVKQEWEYLDIAMRHRKHFSSDSLRKLDSLISIKAFSDRPKQHLAVVLEEINMVDQKLDQMD